MDVLVLSCILSLYIPQSTNSCFYNCISLNSPNYRKNLEVVSDWTKVTWPEMWLFTHYPVCSSHMQCSQDTFTQWTLLMLWNEREYNTKNVYISVLKEIIDFRLLHIWDSLRMRTRGLKIHTVINNNSTNSV